MPRCDERAGCSSRYRSPTAPERCWQTCCALGSRSAARPGVGSCNLPPPTQRDSRLLWRSGPLATHRLAWQECVVSKRSHPVEKQQRALPRKEFDGWMVVAERATNRFAHLLFVLTCWRNLVSQRRGESRSMAMHREEVAPRAERGFRMRLSGSETGDGDGWSGSGASGHDGPSEKDDLPGMSDTGESDAELAENCDRSWIQALDEAVRRRKMQESRQQCRAQRGETLFHMHSALLCRQSEGEGKRGRRNVLSRTKSQGNKMSLTETLSALLVAEESAKLLDQQGVRVSGASASSQSRARGAGRESVEPVIREQRLRQLEQKRSGHLDSELLTSHLEAIDGGCADGQSHRAEYFDWGVERGSFSQWQAPFATTPREDHTLHLSRHHLQLSAPAPDVECRRWVGVQGEEGMRHVPRAGAISGSGCGGGPGRAASDSRGPSSLSARSTEVSETKRYPLSERYTPLERYFSSKECCKESPPAILGIWESPEQAATAFGRKDQEGSGSEGAVPLDEFVSSLARLSRASRDTTGSPLKWQ